MTRTITAKEATIKTAVVEVKALTITGRQVTLSVFRQLKDEPLLDEDTGDLRGVPWGTVNYFWGGCAKAAEHLHVVWQKGDQLRRACVWPRPESAAGHRERFAEAARWLEAAVLLHVAEAGPDHGLTRTDTLVTSRRGGRTYHAVLPSAAGPGHLAPAVGAGRPAADLGVRRATGGTRSGRRRRTSWPPSRPRPTNGTPPRWRRTAGGRTRWPRRCASTSGRRAARSTGTTSTSGSRRPSGGSTTSRSAGATPPPPWPTSTTFFIAV